MFLFFFFFNDTATTEIYTLSLHDALPISGGLVLEADGLEWVLRLGVLWQQAATAPFRRTLQGGFFKRDLERDRKSTRLNSSHANISYAVFCLKKKKNY